MSELSRRDALRAFAAGAAGALARAPGLAQASDGMATQPASASTLATTDAPIPAGSPRVPAGTLEAVREVALRLGPPPARRRGRVVLARVLLCRSWERRVYLYESEEARGFVDVTPEGFALAAACEAAGRPLAALVWGAEPGWAGVGRFEGAYLAVDAASLPSEPQP